MKVVKLKKRTFIRIPSESLRVRDLDQEITPENRHDMIIRVQREVEIPIVRAFGFTGDFPSGRCVKVFVLLDLGENEL
jgi:hypothetical protein